MKKIFTLLLLGGVLFSSNVQAQKRGLARIKQAPVAAEQVKPTAIKQIAGRPDIKMVSAEEARATVQPGKASKEARGFRRIPSINQLSSVAAVKANAPRKASTEVQTPDYEATDLSLWDIVNVNGDTRTWTTSGATATYNYNGSQAADDWLISPPVQLKAGQPYYVRFSAYARSAGYPEKLEAKWGNGATPDDLTSVILEPTTLTNTEPQAYEVEITPDADGNYYFGFHAISDPDKWSLYVTNISIVKGPSVEAPAAVTNLTATPAADASLKATLSFTAPTTKINGEVLNSIDGVRIISNGEELADLKRVQPGKQLTFEDSYVEAAGNTTYTLIPYNEEGDGSSTSITVYIGLDTPTTPEDVVATDNGAEGYKLTWSPATAANGGIYFPENVKYGVGKIQYYDPYAGTSYEGYYGGYYVFPLDDDAEEFDYVQATEFVNSQNTQEGPQQQLWLAVNADNTTADGAAGGQSEYFGTANPLLIGAPYVLPLTEGFADWTQQDDPLFFNGEDDRLWIDNSEAVNSYGGLMRFQESADGDGYAIALVGATGDFAELTSGKISLAGAVAPKLVFKHLDYAEAATLFVSVIDSEGNYHFLNGDNGQALTEINEEWTVSKYDLSEFINEPFIQIDFALIGTNTQAYDLFEIDQLKIADFYQKDLSVDVSAPEEVQRGTTASIAVRVNNEGEEDVDGFKLKLTVGDDVVVNYTVGGKLAAFESKRLVYTYDVKLVEAAEQLTAKAEVTIADEENDEDNTAEAIISLKSSDVVTASDLTATANTDDIDNLSVALAWTAPVTEATVQTVTESFEDYDSWAITGIGGWTLYDGDAAVTGGLINGLEFTNQGSPFAFIVFDDSNYGGYDLDDALNNYTGQLDARTGNKALFSIYNDDYSDNDDWAISPQLSGNAQDVTFYVRPVGWNADATYEVLTSTTGNAPADFTLLQSYAESSEDWVERTVSLPEGTKYFAIRHTTNGDDAYYFYIDDVTYEIIEGNPNGDVDFYRVYRDGELIAETTSTSFTDTEVEDDTEYNYQVTVVYKNGVESGPVAATTAIATGINAIITNGQPFNVYSVGGQLVRRQATNVQGLQKGIYVINGKKVIVK